MVNRRVLTIAVGAAPLAAMVACDALVDLGPKATLRDAGAGPTIDAGVDSRTNAPDTGKPEGGLPDSSMLSCGLPPDPNKDCDNCTNMHCCDISTTCGMNPRCVVGEELLLNCVYDATCVNQVEAEYGDAGVVDLVNCVVTYCSDKCFAGPYCSVLAGCCKDVPDAQPVARTLCIGAVNLLDEMNCLKVLNDTLRRELGESFCPGAPDSGGGD
jgi:hypothetical protein